MKDKTSHISLSFSPREEIQRSGYDWELNELDDHGLQRAVRAGSLLQAGCETRIVAVCLQKHEPVYLMDHDARLYYYHGFDDDIINQYFPMEEFLTWKGGLEMAMRSLTPSKEYWPPFPDGWRHCRCYGDAFILVAEEIAEAFKDAVTAGKYMNSYEVLRDFPRIIEQALIFSEKEK